jgi:glycerol-3-phosphate dehydrogenase
VAAFEESLNRDASVARIRERKQPWDMVVIGGGATGAGIALDAATRGYDVVLFEAHDFGKGTSSRSTKLVHGGVRYLRQGNIGLVRESLRERGILRRNAPGLVRELGFVLPAYSWWEKPFYAAGLSAYDLLAGAESFGRSRILSRSEAVRAVPNLRADGLAGGIVYFDGQFEDARLLIAIVRTAASKGATLVNYCPVVAAGKEIVARDVESGEELAVRGRVVINATGAFCDAVRSLANANAEPLVAPSQGAHVVLDRSFLGGDHAVLVPRTRDGRVMFAIPWLGYTLVGTTDTPVATVETEPRPLEQEIDFVLETAGRYLDRRPSRADVLSTWAGIRPLVRSGNTRRTAALSRDHHIHIDDGSGMITITGGKWTTYRAMAEDCVNRAAAMAGLPPRPCLTEQQRLVQSDGEMDAVKRAARLEMARSVEDVLARRTCRLMLDARAAAAEAPAVADALRRELRRDEAWAARQVVAFQRLAESYLPRS